MEEERCWKWKEESIKVGPIYESWTDAIGCMSYIEKEELGEDYHLAMKCDKMLGEEKD